MQIYKRSRLADAESFHQKLSFTSLSRRLTFQAFRRYLFSISFGAVRSIMRAYLHKSIKLIERYCAISLGLFTSCIVRLFLLTFRLLEVHMSYWIIHHHLPMILHTVATLVAILITDNRHFFLHQICFTFSFTTTLFPSQQRHPFAPPTHYLFFITPNQLF